MEIILRRKPRATTTTTTTDELSLTKAAAWAWYQHGSGSSELEKPTREYDLTRSTHRSPQTSTSRYKLEALQKSAPEKEEEEEEAAAPPTATETSLSSRRSTPLLLSPSHMEDNSDLLDTYEIERISRQLDYYIESSKLVSVVAPESEAVGVKVKDTTNEKKIIGKGTKLMGLTWLRHGVACSSRDDVVELALRRRRQLPDRRDVGVVVNGGGRRTTATRG